MPASLKDLLIALRTEREELSSAIGSLRLLVDAENTTSGLPSMQLKPQEHYRLFREYIQHEDGLINNRLLWNINIQGFLFATFGLAVQRLYDKTPPNSTATLLNAIVTILPLFGISVSLLSLVSVRAAEEAIQSLKATWETICSRYPADVRKDLPGIIGGGLEPTHKAGLRAPFLVPIVFIAAWVLLLVGSVRHLCNLHWAGKAIW